MISFTSISSLSAALIKPCRYATPLQALNGSGILSDQYPCERCQNFFHLWQFAWAKARDLPAELDAMNNCAICAEELSGRQVKFCSRQCKNDCTNNRHQSYVAQQKRGRLRKIALISLKGGACTACGYAKNHAAMEFHHVDPELKKFQLDLRSLSNRNWSAILQEAMKCSLMCSNCHKELHNPDGVLGRA